MQLSDGGDGDGCCALMRMSMGGCVVWSGDGDRVDRTACCDMRATLCVFFCELQGVREGSHLGGDDEHRPMLPVPIVGRARGGGVVFFSTLFRGQR